MQFPYLLLFFLIGSNLMPAAEKAFPQTAVGVIEVKTLPAARLIASQTNRAYFENGGSLFRPLFNYIQANDIAMTTPVEAEIEPGVMYFYISEALAKKEFKSTDSVKIHQFPQRQVASIGARGRYSDKNFKKATARLEKWLKDNDSFQVSGEPRGIFWNGPYTPAPFKRFEVHIPVQARAQ